MPGAEPPVENVWQFLRDNWLSNRVFAAYDAIVDHCCDAWNKLAEQPWRVMGAVVGKHDGAGDEFLGIPYAAPPVGQLRFRPLQLHASWLAPHPATDYGSVGPQLSESGVTGHEDCLFLKVFAPAADTAAGHGLDPRLPASMPMPAAIRSTTSPRSSRSSTTGWASWASSLTPPSAPTTGAASPATMASRTSRRRLSGFGGDPDRVTVFGKSAGGKSILIHLASPTASGLFQRAIAESPVYPAPFAAALNGAAMGQACQRRHRLLQAGAGAAAFLRAASVDKLVMLSQKTTERPFGLVAPVIDGFVLKQSLREAFRSGAFNRVPAVIGSNHDEATPADRRAVQRRCAPGHGRAILKLLAGRFGSRNGARVARAYPLARYPTTSQALAAAYTDAVFAWPTERARAALALYSRPTATSSLSRIRLPRRTIQRRRPGSFPAGGCAQRTRAAEHSALSLQEGSLLGLQDLDELIYGAGEGVEGAEGNQLVTVELGEFDPLDGPGDHVARLCGGLIGWLDQDREIAVIVVPKSAPTSRGREQRSCARWCRRSER